MRVKTILLGFAMVSTALSAHATDWIRDAEPAILEVRYMRTEVTDTTQRDTQFFNEETVLRIGKSMSRYYSLPRFNRDSLMYNNPALYWESERLSFEKDPAEHDRTALTRNGRYWNVVYKNYPVGRITETAYFDMQDWRYDEDFEAPGWEITEESREVTGYECIKATADYRGRRWTAWFAPEIPVQDGPWKLCGLPGLILEAYDDNHDYHFVATGLRQAGLGDVGYLSYREKRGIKTVSRDEFFNAWWKYVNSNFGTKVSAMFGRGPQPGDYKKPVPHHDREEITYPHDL